MTLGQSVMVLHVNNNLKAADILLDKLPSKGGAKQPSPRDAVLTAMEGAHDRMALTKARKAFGGAAREADIPCG